MPEDVPAPALAVPRCSLKTPLEASTLEEAALMTEVRANWDVARKVAEATGQNGLCPEIKAVVSESESESLGPRPSKRRKILSQKQREISNFRKMMLETPRMPDEPSFGPDPGSEWWLDALFEVLDPFDIADSVRRTFPGGLTYGSDCSGVDAPAIALKSLLEALAHKALAKKAGYSGFASKIR